MNRSENTFLTREPATAVERTSTPSEAEPAPCCHALAFELELQSLSGLLTVLTTVARLGGNLTCLEAAQGKARLGVDVPRQVAHRLEGLLGQLVEVLCVRALP
jgi:hypothetical protein